MAIGHVLLLVVIILTKIKTIAFMNSQMIPICKFGKQEIVVVNFKILGVFSGLK